MIFIPNRCLKSLQDSFIHRRVFSGPLRELSPLSFSEQFLGGFQVGLLDLMGRSCHRALDGARASLEHLHDVLFLVDVSVFVSDRIFQIKYAFSGYGAGFVPGNSFRLGHRDDDFFVSCVVGSWERFVGMVDFPHCLFDVENRLVSLRVVAVVSFVFLHFFLHHFAKICGVIPSSFVPSFQSHPMECLFHRFQFHLRCAHVFGQPIHLLDAFCISVCFQAHGDVLDVFEDVADVLVANEEKRTVGDGSVHAFADTRPFDAFLRYVSSLSSFCGFVRASIVHGPAWPWLSVLRHRPRTCDEWQIVLS